MPQFFPLPDKALIGSHHVLKTPDGHACIGRYDMDGWTIFLAQRPMSAPELRAQGYELARSILEGRRVLSGDPPLPDGDQRSPIWGAKA